MIGPVTRSLLVLAMVVGAAACYDEPAGLDQASKDIKPTAALVSGQIEELAGDPLFLELAREDSTFAGLFFDDAGNVVVSLTDTDRLSALRPRIQEIVSGRTMARGDRVHTGTPIQAREADYSYLELARYRTVLRQELFGIQSVATLGVDETVNRVRVGIVDQGAEPQVQALLSEVGIPQEAVNIGITTRAVSTSHRLDDDSIPDGLIEGGWDIGPDGCTLGFPAVRSNSGTRVFVTASHCSDVMWSDDGGDFTQPGTGGSVIGYELDDPDSWSCFHNTGYLDCRYSDATLVEAEDSIDLGRIARTTYAGTTIADGSIVIDHNNPEFTITSKDDAVLNNEVVHKVGRTSGWTYGTVIQTCDDVTDGNNNLILCSDKVDMVSRPGDSGAPVFQMKADSTAELRGITWGHDDDHNPDLWMSGLDQIQKDLGGLIVYETATVLVSIDGPTTPPNNAFCTWTADVTPGLPAYSYEWYRDGQLVSTTGSYTADTGTTSFDLEVYVTDSRTDTASDMITVSPSSSGGGCTV